jgi:hypothetical protein
VKRIAPLQLGKMSALLYGAMGLLFLPVFLIMAVASAAAPEAQQIGIFAFGAGFALLAPVMYAVMGFIVGVIGAALYNLFAKWVGGIEVEVE